MGAQLKPITAIHVSEASAISTDPLTRIVSQTRLRPKAGVLLSPLDATSSDRQHLEQMAVRILEVEPPPAAAMVDLHVAG